MPVRYPRELSDRARAFLRALITLEKVQGIPRRDAIDRAATVSGLSPRYVRRLLLPSPAAKEGIETIVRDMLSTSATTGPLEDLCRS